MPVRLAVAFLLTFVLALIAVPVVAGYLAGPHSTSVPAAPVGSAGVPLRAPAPLPVRRVVSRAQPEPMLEAVPGPYGSMRATTSPSVALTFDDGPNPQWTPRVLALLARYHITATFCLIGVNVQAHPQLVRQIVAGGNTLCNHTWTHNENLGRLSPAAIKADLTRTSNAIRAADPGASIPYFRQPGGDWTASIVDTVRSLGMRSLGWDVDPRDWTIPPVPTIERIVTAGCRPGNIILMHDGGGDRSHTYLALSSILPMLVGSRTFVALPDDGM